MKNSRLFAQIAIALLLIGIFTALPLVKAPTLVSFGDVKAVPLSGADFVADGAYPPGQTFKDFVGGTVAFDQDMINVEQLAHPQDKWYGRGVVVAVLDTGLLPNWNYFFPKTRILGDLGIGFVQDLDTGVISTVPWDDAVSGHGTHVTSTIIGYNLRGRPMTGVAPLAKIIPVKVLSYYDYDNYRAWGTSGMVAAGIDYVTSLVKSGVLSAGKVIINMSLGSSVPMEDVQAAIDRAIAAGIIVVASAGNAGDAGMGYPGAYPEVISAGWAGWTGQWIGSAWYRTKDVPEDLMTLAPYSVYYGYRAGTQVYMDIDSSRALPGQDLDVVAPGGWVVGPYWDPYFGPLPEDPTQCYFYVSGTSMASPHVAGACALLAEKTGKKLTAGDMETILENTANLACVTYPNGGWLGPLPYMAIYQDPYGVWWTEWDNNAVGAGFLQVNAAVAAVNP